MTTALALCFPWGSYHANPWGRHVNEAATEWPPSPWRVLRALYSTWQCRATHLEQSVVHALLDGLAEPPRFFIPVYTEAQTRHYFPDLTHMKGRPKWKRSGQQLLPGYSEDAKDKAIDAFVAIAPDAELIVEWDIDLPPVQRAVLGELASLLPYIGRAESLCEARLLDASEPHPQALNCRPTSDDATSAQADARTIRLLVPERPLDFDALTLRPVDVRRARLLHPRGTTWQRYEVPSPTAPAPAGPQTRPRSVEAIRYALHAPATPSRHAAVAVGDVLRRASMSRYGAQNAGAASSALSGKDEAGHKLPGPHRHAHYLAFSRRENPLLEHVVVWAPGGLGARELEALEALSELRYRGASDFRECRLGVEAVGSIGSVAPELVGPAARWRSFTPFAPTRHGKRRSPWSEHVEGEVRLELGYRGLPEPAAVRVTRGSWLSFRRFRPTSERLEDGRRAVGVEIEFEVPVEGPIALGALSHFGLGLFLPVTTASDAKQRPSSTRLTGPSTDPRDPR